MFIQFTVVYCCLFSVHLSISHFAFEGMLLALTLLVPGHCFYFCLSHADDEAQFCFNLYFVLVVQAVGELLAYRNVPLINWVSTGQSIANKIVLDTYIRTMAPISSLGE